MPLDDFPRYPLTFGDSPIHPLPRLTNHLGDATIWAKREDCNSGLAFGGNKTRNLEYLVPEALALARTPWCRSAACSPTTVPDWVCKKQQTQSLCRVAAPPSSGPTGQVAGLGG